MFETTPVSRIALLHSRAWCIYVRTVFPANACAVVDPDNISINTRSPHPPPSRRRPLPFYNSLTWPLLQFLAKLLPDLIVCTQNTTFCQQNGIQWERTHKKFQYSAHLGLPPSRTTVTWGLLEPYRCHAPAWRHLHPEQWTVLATTTLNLATRAMVNRREHGLFYDKLFRHYTSFLTYCFSEGYLLSAMCIRWLHTSLTSSWLVNSHAIEGWISHIQGRHTLRYGKWFLKIEKKSFMFTFVNVTAIFLEIYIQDPRPSHG